MFERLHCSRPLHPCATLFDAVRDFTYTLSIFLHGGTAPAQLQLARLVNLELDRELYVYSHRQKILDHSSSDSQRSLGQRTHTRAHAAISEMRTSNSHSCLRACLVKESSSCEQCMLLTSAQGSRYRCQSATRTSTTRTDEQTRVGGDEMVRNLTRCSPPLRHLPVVPTVGGARSSSELTTASPAHSAHACR
jgi:hypothetical protein